MSSSSNRPPTVLNPTLLNDIYKRSLKHEKNLKETLQRKSNFTEANSNCDVKKNKFFQKF